MANEELFTNAPKDSVLFRLSQKNVYAHPDVSAKSMVESTDLLAYYNSVTNVAEYIEFKTCLVSVLTMYTNSMNSVAAMELLQNRSNKLYFLLFCALFTQYSLAVNIIDLV